MLFQNCITLAIKTERGMFSVYLSFVKESSYIRVNKVNALNGLLNHSAISFLLYILSVSVLFICSFRLFFSSVRFLPSFSILFSYPSVSHPLLFLFHDLPFSFFSIPFYLSFLFKLTLPLIRERFYTGSLRDVSSLLWD